MKQIIFLSIIFSFLSCIINNEEVLAFESMNTSITPRIVGGNDAHILESPYVASIRRIANYICTATIIGEFDFLAPAHCFTHKSPNVIWPYQDITIHTSTSSSKAVGMFYYIRKVFVHPGWTGTGIRVHDIAIAKVTSTVAKNSYQAKVNLPLQDVRSHLRSKMTGWGRTEHSNGITERLQMVHMWTLEYDVCQLFMHPDLQLQKEQFCAYQQEGIGCTESDDGAPLVIRNEVIGIHNWIASDLCAAGHPEINANVFAERDFLFPITQSND